MPWSLQLLSSQVSVNQLLASHQPTARLLEFGDPFFLLTSSAFKDFGRQPFHPPRLAVPRSLRVLGRCCESRDLLAVDRARAPGSQDCMSPTNCVCKRTVVCVVGWAGCCRPLHAHARSVFLTTCCSSLSVRAWLCCASSFRMRRQVSNVHMTGYHVGCAATRGTEADGGNGRFRSAVGIRYLFEPSSHSCCGTEEPPIAPRRRPRYRLEKRGRLQGHGPVSRQRGTVVQLNSQGRYHLARA